MNVIELNEILATQNVYKIHRFIKSNGFRATNLGHVDEFCFAEFESTAGNVINITRRNSKSSRFFKVNLFTGVENFKGYDFISLEVYMYIKEEDIDFPIKVFFYTNAPIDEEFKKRSSEIFHCARCNNPFSRKYLIEEDDGKLYCRKCLVKRKCDKIFEDENFTFIP